MVFESCSLLHTKLVVDPGPADLSSNHRSMASTAAPAAVYAFSPRVIDVKELGVRVWIVVLSVYLNLEHEGLFGGLDAAMVFSFYL